MSRVFCKKLFVNENEDMDSKSGCAGKLFAHPVALGDAPGGPLDRNGVEVEEAGKGLEMMRCFERGE